jgi:precorrin isomerase
LTAHPIEEESFRILRTRLDLTSRAPGERSVIERIVHASADLEFATSTVVTEGSVKRGAEALGRGAPVVVDVEMVGAGISGYPTECHLRSAEAGPGGYPTRTAMGIRAAAAQHPEGAVWVVGCAPTALSEILELIESGALRPALVIGLPVGFVGAAEAKAATRALAERTGLATITNVGEKGGSAVAAAAFNAIVRISRLEA